MKNRIAIAGLGLLLTACAAVGPDYESPMPDLSSGFHGVDGAERSGPVRSDWWEALEDAQLTGYIRDAVAG